MRASWKDNPDARGPGSHGGGPTGPESMGGVQFAMPPLTPAVRALIYVTGAVFAVTFLLFVVGPTRSFANDLHAWFGVNPSLWSEWALPPVWQVFSWGFLHSYTDPTHVLFNMLFLYFLGTMLEGIIGARRLFMTYVSALVLGGVVVALVGSLIGSANITVGASGAVMAVVVAMASLRPTQRILFILFPITLKTLAILYIGMDVFRMLLDVAGQGGGNVSYTAHLAGAAWGYLLVKRGWIWRDPVEGVEAWRGERQEKREVLDEGKLDELLAKINREGIHSLSGREKAFLKRASKRR